ncbi:MAG: heavy metal translocating P-type ATPase [Pseudomonadota bacterium]|nr:heavy metal translocating P-type ATPase [Pseudomonadota bacterium]
MSDFDQVQQALVQPASADCFHCGDPLPKHPLYSVILAEPRAMCCLGCQLASQSIVEAGLESYYLDRTEISRTAPLPEQLSVLSGYDHAQVQQAFVYRDHGLSAADLSVVGLRCAACSWLIERRLLAETGVAQATVNLATQRLHLVWQAEQTKISHLIEEVERLGYRARPFRQDTHAELLAKQSRQMLMRLGVAGLGAMQAMMYAMAVYFGDYSGIDVQFRDYFRWVGMLVSLPVLLYAGFPFYQSAWRAIQARTVNMDIPVSIALILTFAASSYATLTQSGEVYFDSVSMFVFFLLGGRYLELQARQKASQTASDLITIEPILVHKLVRTETGEHVEEMAAHLLQIGDRLQIRAGESIPCDGVVIGGTGSVSEALLTGEAQPVSKTVGDTLLGGSQNYAHPLLMQVVQPPEGSQRALIDRLMNRALAERPRAAQRADQMAKWFVARVLLLSVLVYVGWFFVDPTLALWATVAVLVATCPCALSLATPMALTTATNRLATQGFLLTRGHVMETLAKATHVIFDKTGTLTQGQPVLVKTTLLDTSVTVESALQWATALEQTSNHPLAKAFRQAWGGQSLPEVIAPTHIAGGGISGQIADQTYRLGHAQFSGLAHASDALTVVLAVQSVQGWQPLAQFEFADQVRDDAAQTVQALKQQGLAVWMLSGDPTQQPQQVGQALGIDVIHGGLLPEQKVAAVKALQEDGATVVMVGDGVNDGPVLATANLSVAMSSGADLAQISADSILLNDQLTALVDACRVSGRADQVIRQNLRWAFGYNLAILVPAALGYVPPWLAAIGMSLSSLLVVLNALRLRHA